MVITYYGLSCYKVQFGDTIIAFNPISKASSYKTSTFGADVALISVNDPDYNGREQVAYGSREPFLIEGPGEYEIGGIYVRGFGTEQNWGAGAKSDEGKKINTIYSVLFEGVNLCHLGAQKDATIPPLVTESLGEIDLLLSRFLEVIRSHRRTQQRWPQHLSRNSSSRCMQEPQAERRRSSVNS